MTGPATRNPEQPRAAFLARLLVVLAVFFAVAPIALPNLAGASVSLSVGERSDPQIRSADRLSVVAIAEPPLSLGSLRNTLVVHKATEADGAKKFLAASSPTALASRRAGTLVAPEPERFYSDRRASAFQSRAPPAAA